MHPGWRALGRPSAKVAAADVSEWEPGGGGAGGPQRLFACEGWITRTRHQCDASADGGGVAYAAQSAELAVWVTGTTPSG